MSDYYERLESAQKYYFTKDFRIKPNRICPVLDHIGFCKDQIDDCPDKPNHLKYSCALSRSFLVEKYLK